MVDITCNIPALLIIDLGTHVIQAQRLVPERNVGQLPLKCSGERAHTKINGGKKINGRIAKHAVGRKEGAECVSAFCNVFKFTFGDLFGSVAQHQPFWILWS
jgi:hypothetical protein